MSKKIVLGRGLSILIPAKPIITPTPETEIPERRSEETVASQDRILDLSPEVIYPNSNQPRRDFDAKSLEDLAISIKQHGILQPLVVTAKGDGSYILVAGERRWRAAKFLGSKTVPVVVRTTGELERFALAMIENIQRQDLNAIELALGYNKLLEDFSLTQEELAKKMGKSRSVIANHLRLLGLPSEIQQSLAKGEISEYQARNLLSIAQPEARHLAWEKMKKGQLTGDAARYQAQKTQVAAHERTRPRDPATRAQENALEATLGTRVRIKKQGDSGQMVIDFYSLEDLGRLVEKISAVK